MYILHNKKDSGFERVFYFASQENCLYKLHYFSYLIQQLHAHHRHFRWPQGQMKLASRPQTCKKRERPIISL